LGPVLRPAEQRHLHRKRPASIGRTDNKTYPRPPGRKEAGLAQGRYEARYGRAILDCEQTRAISRKGHKQMIMLIRPSGGKASGVAITLWASERVLAEEGKESDENHGVAGGGRLLVTGGDDNAHPSKKGNTRVALDISRKRGRGRGVGRPVRG